MPDFSKKAGVLRKTTLVDYPGHVACAFFLSGCNLKCPYCYNTGLVLSPTQEDLDSFSTIEDLFTLMDKRSAVLQGIAISGGEPLINPLTPFIIRKAKTLGMHVKIDTNGVNPEKLEEFLNEKELTPDFIAMDLKTAPQRYALEMVGKEYIHYGDTTLYTQKLKKSAQLLSSLPSEKREFRTVMVPNLVTKKDIDEMASILPKNASWQFAPFRNENCIDPAYNNITPYSIIEMEELVEYAKSLIPGAALR